ncbi:MAG: V-type ATP synthase subunit I [Oscillospiraceae bacterium]|nr:V-type ATP synthase subunit I [Oscillospiraceae bacterium]
MAKIKLQRFEIVALLSESKRLMDYLQKTGAVQLENVSEEELTKYSTEQIVAQLEKKRDMAQQAFRLLEKYCSLKKGFLESFSDCKEIDYNDYKLLSEKSEELTSVCREILSLETRIEEIKTEISNQNTLCDYYVPWSDLDIPMSCRRTLTTSLFIGTFPEEYTKQQLLDMIAEKNPELDDVEIEIVSHEKMLTCAVFMCHISHGTLLEATLREMGFNIPDKVAPKLPTAAAQDCRQAVSEGEASIRVLEKEIQKYGKYYDELRFLSDYYTSQAEKYTVVENAASTQMTFYIRGYIPKRIGEDIKFEIENSFKAQMELSEPDYENDDVPVLIENPSFAAGVESITNMYSPPSNHDVDPNPVMSFFFYAFFGLMLSDAGYGILLVIFALVAKFKLKVTGNMKKTADMVLYCGCSTVFWGALFGGWFGDAIPTICTAFLGFETAPDLAIWMNPMNNSIKLLLYCFLFGIIHLFAGLAMRFFMLMRDKNYIGAFCDTIPVVVFVIGFAIVGTGFFTYVDPAVKSVGVKILAVGAALIVLTAGRSSKNILGKLGGGLYGLYNTASGYLGDILSYSRLLALSLVTGVIANVINLLGAMMGNIFFFAVVFLLGHTVNIAINLIGTYVHTSRLQYVEFFSKFYEGSGRTFTPFRIKSKFFSIKEENKYG